MLITYEKRVVGRWWVVRKSRAEKQAEKSRNSRFLFLHKDKTRRLGDQRESEDFVEQSRSQSSKRTEANPNTNLKTNPQRTRTRNRTELKLNWTELNDSTPQLFKKSRREKQIHTTYTYTYYPIYPRERHVCWLPACLPACLRLLVYLHSHCET